MGSNKLKFHFPKPGPIEGVKSKGKALIKVVDVSFKYPRNDKVTIEKATVQVSLSSRVACIGPNGAGKSTLIKCLTGEVQPTTGTVWQHPNARIGYIAQHAFHHIEQHMDKTPNEYIRWRYAGGEDREAIAKDTMKISDAELELQKTVIDFVYTDPDTQNYQDQARHQAPHRRAQDQQVDEGERLRGPVQGAPRRRRLQALLRLQEARQVGLGQGLQEGRRQGRAGRVRHVPARRSRSCSMPPCGCS